MSSYCKVSTAWGEPTNLAPMWIVGVIASIVGAVFVALAAWGKDEENSGAPPVSSNAKNLSQFLLVALLGGGGYMVYRAYKTHMKHTKAWKAWWETVIQNHTATVGGARFDREHIYDACKEYKHQQATNAATQARISRLEMSARRQRIHKLKEEREGGDNTYGGIGWSAAAPLGPAEDEVMTVEAEADVDGPFTAASCGWSCAAEQYEEEALAAELARLEEMSARRQRMRPQRDEFR